MAATRTTSPSISLRRRLRVGARISLCDFMGGWARAVHRYCALHLAQRGPTDRDHQSSPIVPRSAVGLSAPAGRNQTGDRYLWSLALWRHNRLANARRRNWHPATRGGNLRPVLVRKHGCSPWDDRGGRFSRFLSLAVGKGESRPAADPVASFRNGEKGLWQIHSTGRRRTGRWSESCST